VRKRSERKAQTGIWEEVAQAVGGTVVGERKWCEDSRKIEVPTGDGLATITLDVYQTVMLIGKAVVPVQYARATAAFPVHGEGLRLSVTRANPFTGLGKLFGMQDLEVGDSKFDQAVVVKGSEPEQVLRLLSGESGAALRSHLLALPDLSFGVSDDGREAYIDRDIDDGTGTEYDVVYAISGRVEAEQFVALYHLLRETLQGLQRIGVAQAADR
jgi:hypothetical protein